MYSQGEEEKFIIEFFKGFKGAVLDIGANDGKTFSNSLRLIELGWEALLVEPSPVAFIELVNLHLFNDNVELQNVAIGTEPGKMILHESGAHVKGGGDVSLVSSLDVSETERWKKNGVKYNEIEVSVIRIKDLLPHQTGFHFDFITIDAEGFDLAILKQIDLTCVKLLCIEWNSIEEIKKEILQYTSTFGMDNIIYQSGENLLICRKQ